MAATAPKETRRKKKMRRTTSDFRRDAKAREAYEIELTDGTIVPLRPSTDLPIEDQIRLQQWTPADSDTNPLEIQLRHMTGEHYDAFWAEWKREPRYALDNLVNEVDAHFAADVDEGKGQK